MTNLNSLQSSQRIENIIPEAEKVLVLPISDALQLIDRIWEWKKNTNLLWVLTSARTKLLQMEKIWIDYVSGAIRIMDEDLASKNHIPLPDLVKALTV